MYVIKHLTIKHFRSISNLAIHPSSGMNCIIGPGDSGKSTILDAIDWVLGARRSLKVSDSDFYKGDISQNIEISATVSVPEQVMSLDRYGYFIRGYNPETKEVHEEPLPNDIPVLTIQLVISADLEPIWRLYSERSQALGIERDIQWKHREILAPARLGVGNNTQFTLSTRSILRKLVDADLDFSKELSSLHRASRLKFSDDTDISMLSSLKECVESISRELGVSLNDVTFGIDAESGLSNSSIALHDQNNLPVRGIGTGSARLLLSGLQNSNAQSTVLLIDEAEYGLEPYRIALLLKLLGSKNPVSASQSFITTHSPFVIRELAATQLAILRKFHTDKGEINHILIQPEGTAEQQATLRACAEAFFAKRVIVCEGATEVGFLRAFDHAWSLCGPGYTGLQNSGVYWSDGNGEGNMIKRASVFHELGYETYLFKDSDISTKSHLERTQDLKDKGVGIIEWGDGMSIEKAIINHCPVKLLDRIVSIAKEMHSEQQISQNIVNFSCGNLTMQTLPESYGEIHRSYIADAAGKYEWFKSIYQGEELVARIIAPFWQDFTSEFQNVVNLIWGTTQ